MDPLAQLKDIATPTQISQFPAALGWWLLLAVLVISLCVFIYKIKKYRANIKLKKMAINQITENTALTETIRILKWAAMAYFPRNEVASLSGSAFAAYLTEKLPTGKQQAFSLQTQPHWDALYQKSAQENIVPEFNQAAIFWLKKSLPPKQQSNGDHP